MKTLWSISRLLLVILSAQTVLSADAELRTVVMPPFTIKSFTELNAQAMMIDNGTVVFLFDLDKTIVRDKYFLHMAYNHSNAEFERARDHVREILVELAAEGKFDIKEIDDFLVHVYHTTRWASGSHVFKEEFVDKDFEPFFRDLKLRGAVTMGLTARSSAIFRCTVTSLNKLGIDFHSPSKGATQTEWFNNNQECLSNEIYFTSHQCKKAERVDNLLHRLENNGSKAPFVVFAVDDNLDEIAGYYQTNYSQQHDAQIYPIIYTGFDAYFDEISKDPEKYQAMLKEEIETFYLKLYEKYKAWLEMLSEDF